MGTIMDATNHQVRLAQLPTFAPPRQRRQVRRITLHETFSDPLLDDSDLIGAQSSFVGELTVTWFRKPRRHVPALGHFRDELGVLIDCFNEMLAQIQQRDAELIRHREHLEEEVQARTLELRKTNTDKTA